MFCKLNIELRCENPVLRKGHSMQNDYKLKHAPKRFRSQKTLHQKGYHFCKLNADSRHGNPIFPEDRAMKTIYRVKHAPMRFISQKTHCKKELHFAN